MTNLPGHDIPTTQTTRHGREVVEGALTPSVDESGAVFLALAWIAGLVVAADLGWCRVSVPAGI